MEESANFPEHPLLRAQRLEKHETQERTARSSFDFTQLDEEAKQYASWQRDNSLNDTDGNVEIAKKYVNELKKDIEEIIKELSAIRPDQMKFETANVLTHAIACYMGLVANLEFLNHWEGRFLPHFMQNMEYTNKFFDPLHNSRVAGALGVLRGSYFTPDRLMINAMIQDMRNRQLMWGVFDGPDTPENERFDDTILAMSKETQNVITFLGREYLQPNSVYFCPKNPFERMIQTRRQQQLTQSTD